MDVTKIIEAIITLIMALLTTVLIPYLKSKISESKYAELKVWVKAAVNAAEMIYTESGKGKEKKEYVLKFLESKGFILDEDVLDVIIESSVLELKKEIME